VVVGLGVDLFDVTRMRAELRRHGFDLPHLFAPSEIEQCRGRRRPEAELAARFASKEAVVKALGDEAHTGPHWPEIEILASADGHPRVHLHGGSRERARQLGVTRIHLSTTYAAGVAIATAVLEATS
jgi:holo-[acyl-carrier protein] synthase